MADRTPLFLGLTRPPKYLGLPIGYLVLLATGTTLPFVWTGSFAFFVAGAVAYPVLWILSEREPHIFELLAVSHGRVRETRNRSLYGGDSYGA